MDDFANIPVVYKILGSLAVILIANRFIKKLFIPIFLGTMTLGICSGHNISNMATIASQRFFSFNNIFLLLVTIQVIALSDQMSRSGVMKELVRMIKARISQRASLAVLPAIIGFLPMPGGAIFSAPLVDDCDHRKEVEPLLKTQINYWFRHIWEYWWPLYPGVLLALEISKLDIGVFMLVQFPFCLCSVGCGYFFLLRKVKQNKDHINHEEFHAKRFLKLTIPIIIIIVTAMVLKMTCPYIANLSRFLPMVIGLFLASIVLQILRPLDLNEWKRVISSKTIVNMLALVALIRVYGAFIEADLPNGIPLVATMRYELVDAGISSLLIIMIIPFITGFTMGIAIGFVGASFPIVFSLLGPDPSLQATVSTTILAFTFGYMGMMLSPVHICLIVSNEHFKTSLFHSLKRLLKPAATMMLFALIIYYAMTQLL